MQLFFGSFNPSWPARQMQSSHLCAVCKRTHTKIQSLIHSSLSNEGSLDGAFPLESDNQVGERDSIHHAFTFSWEAHIKAVENIRSMLWGMLNDTCLIVISTLYMRQIGKTSEHLPWIARGCVQIETDRAEMPNVKGQAKLSCKNE